MSSRQRRPRSNGRCAETAPVAIICDGCHVALKRGARPCTRRSDVSACGVPSLCRILCLLAPSLLACGATSNGSGPLDAGAGGFGGAGGHGGSSGAAGSAEQCSLTGAAGTGGAAIDPAFSTPDFRTIELREVRYLGCKEEGAVISATIVRTDDGTASIAGARSFEAEPETWSEESFEPALISACDASALQTLIAAVPATRSCIYGNGACGACRNVFLAVNGDEAEWSACCVADGFVEYTDSLIALVDAIEALAP